MAQPITGALAGPTLAVAVFSNECVFRGERVAVDALRPALRGVPALRQHIRHVVVVRPEPQVRRIDAEAVVALV
jgi:hypothetical protein